MVRPARKDWAPDCGEIIWLVFDPQAGHEQAGRRPALVLSPEIYNQDRGLAIVCPITSRAKGFSYETPLPDELEISGVIMAGQIKSID